jgi:NADH dehydrogenase FAD-containing subunit
MKVVIVGGGFCGSLVAKELDRREELNVTLLDKKDYFEYTPSVPKLLTKSKYHSKIIVPYKRFLKKTQILTETVTRVTPQIIETKSKKIPFDYLVLSTGVEYPIFLENTKNVFTMKSGETVKQASDMIKEATKIIIVGGGLIGTEVAAELSTMLPEKQIVLVHSQDLLINRNPMIASKYATWFLRNHGVEIVYNEKIKHHKNGIFITDKKRTIHADVGLWCSGNKANPWFMDKFESNIFTDDKELRVNQFLQLHGYRNIFIGGDITDISEEKTAQNADRHARLITYNVLQSIQKKPLRAYKTRVTPLIISLGNSNGLIIMSRFVLPGSIPSIGKWAVEKFVLGRLLY